MCAPKSMLSPWMPRNASSITPAAIGAHRRKPRRRSGAWKVTASTARMPIAPNTDVEAPIDACEGGSIRAFRPLPKAPEARIASQATPLPTICARKIARMLPACQQVGQQMADVGVEGKRGHGSPPLAGNDAARDRFASQFPIVAQRLVGGSGIDEDQRAPGEQKARQAASERAAGSRARRAGNARCSAIVGGEFAAIA